jgi:hypothetical protein
MCRITPNQPDKNPCAILCPEINERLTGIINIELSVMRPQELRGAALLAKRAGGRAAWLV